jgi:signal transduction histidine kinase
MPTTPAHTVAANADAHPGILRDTSFCAVIAVNSEQRITAFSPEAERLTNLTAAHVIGQSAVILPHALHQLITETFTHGRAIPDRLLKLPAPGGDEHSIRAHVVGKPAPDGQLVGLILALHDLTAARQLDTHLRRLDRLASLGTLSAGMAHEVKNALVAVKTFLDLLLEKNQDAELADTVRREMTRIDAIVSQMLHTASPAKTQRTPVHIHDALDHAFRLLEHPLHEKLITVHRRLHATHDLLLGDLHQVEQAVMNLLLNALEAMGPHGELTVITENIPTPASRTALLRLAVSDTGVGIPTENLDRMFETFFTTKKSGTGLGLPITRRIIEELHGQITVISEPGTGTTFTVLLPLIPS